MLFCLSFIVLNCGILFIFVPRLLSNLIILFLMNDLSKSPVKLRKKKLANGNESLYLDIYLNGKRKYEYLQMYLIPAKTQNDKALNKRTLLAAEQIKSNRLIELMENKSKFFQRSDYSKDMTILQYIDKAYEKNVTSSIHKVATRIRTLNLDCKVSELCEKSRFNDFANEIYRGLSESYKFNLYNCLRTLTKNLKKDFLIYEEIDLDPVKKVESKREFLTLEEVKRLQETSCDNDHIKNAFLFSCFSGLRISDIMKLRWSDISEVDGYTRVTFVQKKTSKLEYMDISKQAAKYLSLQPKNGDLVFPIKNRSLYERDMFLWIDRAGIRKKITFHCARHTFAVMMIELGTDLFVVSKLLGHKNIVTTQVYAKVLDTSKRSAIDKIPEI